MNEILTPSLGGSRNHSRVPTDGNGELTLGYIITWLWWCRLCEKCILKPKSVWNIQSKVHKTPHSPPHTHTDKIIHFSSSQIKFSTSLDDNPRSFKCSNTQNEEISNTNWIMLKLKFTLILLRNRISFLYSQSAPHTQTIWPTRSKNEVTWGTPQSRCIGLLSFLVFIFSSCSKKRLLSLLMTQWCVEQNVQVMSNTK